MIMNRPAPRRHGARRGQSTVRLQVEVLEARHLLSGVSLTPPSVLLPAAVDNHTLDRSQDLGDLVATGSEAIAGSISNKPVAEVDWYQFTLATPAAVALSTTAGGTLASTLSL